jgi:thiol:disulfide interchange protein/DsbC/DsbD-like thiol-disulfide interchange protein
MNFHIFYRWLVSLFLMCVAIGAAQAQANFASKAIGSVVTTPHVRAELMAYAPDGVQPGKPFWVGLQIQHQPGWHTYWKNPGDSGLPTQLNWALPAGSMAGEIIWPTPQKIPVADLANYGYEGIILLAAPVTVDQGLQSSNGEFAINLKAQWLVCKTECIPEEGEFALKISMRGSTALKRGVFMDAQTHEPKTHTGTATFTPLEKSLKLVVSTLPANWQGKQLEAFPEDAEVIETAAKPEQTWSNGQWSAVMPLNAHRTNSPNMMAWVIKLAGGQNTPSLRVQSKLDGAWPVAAKPAVVSPALDAALAKNKTEESLVASSASWTSATFWLAVVGALLGGLILNLMPCVLPVLAIKLLSFAPKKMLDSKSSVAKVFIESTGAASVHSDDTLSFRSSSGLFAVGVIGSFVLLGALLLALRGAGQSFGWGFQLQSPSMVIALALLFLLIGLNLFEAFELRFVLPQSLVSFQSKHPSVEALASGALAVLIATPCTAPFMGASLGLAIALPSGQAIVIFVALGVGMALPFLLIAAYPRVGSWLLKILPQPGNWMLVMRHFLAWPVFATVVWLLWIYAQQTSMNSAFALVFAFLMLTALIWAIGLSKGLLRTIVVTIFVLCLGASYALWQSSDDAIASPVGAAAPASSATAGVWSEWTLEAQQAARTAGRPVFVDFTAAWCLTCQVNKSSTLKHTDIEAVLKAKNVLLLRADWTKPNSAIAAELARLGRSGLPVYAFYLPGSATPQLLPEVLTKTIILNALAVL